MADTHDLARVVLASVRLFNGVAALLVPGVLAKQVGIDPDENPAAKYVFRMFGVRTVLVAIDLFQSKPDALRVAPLMHGSDTIAAFLAARTGKAPWTIVLISLGNTALAWWMNTRKR
jgi:hypothetical protein